MCAVAAAAAIALCRLLLRRYVELFFDHPTGTSGHTHLSADSLDWHIVVLFTLIWVWDCDWQFLDRLRCNTQHFVVLFLAVTSLDTSPLLDNAPFGEGCWGYKLVSIAYMVLLLHFVFLHFIEFCDLPDRDPKLTASRSQFRAVRNIRGNWFLWSFILIFLTFSASALGSEGYAVDMGSVGAEGFQWRSSAKAHVEELQAAFEPSQTSTNRCIKKRSFKRAIRRAETHGYTMYKGQIYTAQRLGTQYKGNPIDAPKTPNHQPSSKLKRKRFTCLSWNCGGLSPSGWDYLQQWIECQSLDIIMLQETHWKHTSEWVTDHYFALHSGCGESRAGLLSLVSKRLCTMDDLSWHEVIPGRLMHFRVHGRDRALDFLNAYQHIHHTERMEERAQFWIALQTVIASCSKRNHLTLMGDLNTSMRRTSSAVGLDSYLWHGERSKGPNHSDAHQLHNLLMQFDLVVNNFWDAHLGPTYMFGTQHSRIDYMITRRCHSDATAKRVQYLYDFALNCPSGAHHVPMIATLLKAWHPQYPDVQTGWTRAQRLELCRQWTTCNDDVESMQNRIMETVATLPPHGDRLDQLHQALNTFSAPRRSQKHAAVYKFDMAPFRCFQAHTGQLRELKQQNLGNFFKAWYHVIQRQRARKMMRRTSAHARKCRLQHIYDAAGRADAAHDHFRLYQAIRELAPKQPYRRIQIRDPDGALLNPSEAADRICDWFAALYHTDEVEDSCNAFIWLFLNKNFAMVLPDCPCSRHLRLNTLRRHFGDVLPGRFQDFSSPFLSSVVIKIKCQVRGNGAPSASCRSIHDDVMYRRTFVR